MIGPGTGVRVYLACSVTDMRKGIEGLAALAQDHLRQKPTSGSVFAFRGRRGDRRKLLHWDGQGFCLYCKVLERGRFPWPARGDESPPVLPETCSFISRDHIEHVALCIEAQFSLGRRDVRDGSKQTPVVEPIDPSEGGHFQILHVAPRALTMDQLGIVETVNRLSEGVVI